MNIIKCHHCGKAQDEKNLLRWPAKIILNKSRSVGYSTLFAKNGIELIYTCITCDTIESIIR